MSLYRSLGAAGDSAGKRWVSGTETPAGATHDVASGLGVVEQCGVSLAAAPTIDHSMSQAAPKSSNTSFIRIRSYKPTSNSNPTPTTITTGEAEAVTWWAIGY
jgi:hypothetical protein